MNALFKILLFISAAFATQPAFGQVHSNLSRLFSLGVLCGEYGYDSGIGVELGTPSLFNNRMSFRIRANENWLEAYKADFDKWAKYETVTMSFTYNTLIIERARSYVEFGALYVFPDRKFSNKKVHPGFTSSIGVELFVFSNPHINVCYYFSGGYSFVKASAEKLENKPRYGYGLVFNNGFRVYF